MRLDRRSPADYENIDNVASLLKKIAAFRRCGGLLSRLAYERGRKEVWMRGIVTTGTPHTSRNKKQRHSAGCTKSNKVHDDFVTKRNQRSTIGVSFSLFFLDLREIGLLYYVIASAGEILLPALPESGTIQRCCQRRHQFEQIKKGDLLRVRLHYSGVARHSDVHQIEFGWHQLCVSAER